MKKNLPLNDYAIRIKNLTKEYIIHHEKPTFVEKFIRSTDERFIALDSLDLIVRKGEHIGIVGPNGSGKTTLLKIIAGITAPTKGTVSVNGKIVSLIDLEAGFHPDLTGIQNIYLNGMILGISKQRLTALLPEIIAYADIRQFIDAPLFTYSQGMKLRLGFAISIFANPDILILDEGLSVGDQTFQKKSFATIKQTFKKEKTIILVSHWFQLFKQMGITRTLVLNKGKFVQDGKLDILENYNALTSSR